MSANLDRANLEQLGPVAARAAPAPSRRSSAIVGSVLVVGALAWAFLLLRPTLFPPRRVATAPVLVEAGAASAAATVEATGWIEPDPYPTLVRPLVEGVVETIDVVEGREVKARSTVLARLRNTMIEGEAEKMRGMVRHKEAHLPEVRAELAEAKAVLEQRVELRREVARLEGEAAIAKAEIAAAEAEGRAARARLEAEGLEVTAQERLRAGGTGSDVLLARAVAAREAARAEVGAKDAALARAHAALVAAQAQHAIARDALERPLALEAAVATAQAHLDAALVEVEAARIELAVAEREAALLVVVAPTDGVVLQRLATPGSAVGTFRMSKGAAGEMSGSEGDGALVALYDPSRLQARVDVPVASVGGIGAGRRVELSAEALPGRVFRGTVTRVASAADPLKNTLQVKVSIEDPDPLLRPEMLVRARFLADAAAAGRPSTGVRIRVPGRAVREGAVFVFDPTGGGRARRIPVTTGAASGDLVDVTGELSATHRVILDAVADGDRVEVAP